MKLFVDDIRDAPPGWVLARTISEAINLLRRYGVGDFRTEGITHVSLDHDISIPVIVDGIQRPYPSSETFRVVAYYMQECMTGTNPSLNPEMVVTTHSSNPDGRREIVSIFKQIGVKCEETPYPPAHRTPPEKPKIGS